MNAVFHRCPVYRQGDFSNPAPLPPRLECNALRCEAVRDALIEAAAENRGLKERYISPRGNLSVRVRFSCRKNFASCPEHRGVALQGSYGFPRSAKPTADGNWQWIGHPGIDIVGTAGTDTVHSVVRGVVTHLFREGQMGTGFERFGNAIIISALAEERHYLFGHLSSIHPRLSKNSIVEEGALLGFLGQGVFASEDAGPALHFEVATHPFESPYDSAGFPPRIDPIHHLESLGPFRDSTLYFPIPGALNGDKSSHRISADTSGRMYFNAERQGKKGGFYPIGENRFWHGGIHLSAPRGAPIRAPFSGDIVALRLDSDPVRSSGPFGSTNFILMRHFLPKSISTAPQPPHASEAAVSPIYALFMHLPAREALARPGGIDDAAAELPWLSRALFPPEENALGKSANAQREIKRAHKALEDALSAEPDDVIADDSTYALTGDVICEDKRLPAAYKMRRKPGKSRRDKKRVDDYWDVQWVQKRLIRLGYDALTVNGVADAHLEHLIRHFQSTFVSMSDEDLGGAVTVRGETVKQLRKPLALLEYEKRLGDMPAVEPPASPIDERFFDALTEIGQDALTKVVTGFHSRVSAGEVLWYMGDSDPDGGASNKDPRNNYIHFEIFSRERMVRAWQTLEETEGADPTKNVSVVHAIEKAIGVRGPLTADRLRAFFQTDASSFLRKRETCFTSEWCADLKKHIAYLRELGYDTIHLEKELAPYLFWRGAATVLPDTPRVWHVNPIAFIETYQACILDARANHPKGETALP